MDDNDVPPLEDMSELLQQVSNIKESRTNTKSTTIVQPKPHSNGTSLIGNGDMTTTADESPPEPKTNIEHKAESEEPAKKNISNSDKSFGGMKKGFLFGSPNKSKQTVSMSSESRPTALKSDTKKLEPEEIPMIKPKVSKEEEYRIPEVQKAMSAGQALMNNKEWMTEDLLNNVSKNETLVKRLGDPRFMQAMQEFQSNPTAATEKYKDNQEVQQFFKEFCGLMGEHFNHLADTQQSSGIPQAPASDQSSVQIRPVDSGVDMKVSSSTNPKQATAADEEKMQQILSNPEIRDILLDPRIQKIIETLRTDPDKVQNALRMADTDLRKKISKLVDCGLLQFQT